MKLTTLFWLLLCLLGHSNNMQGQSLDTLISINSSILGEERRIQIGLPLGYFESDDAFSTLYIMDAEYRYDVCRSIQQYLGISTRIPPTILVGIQNLSRETRNRDMLPPNFGGTDSLFRKFIELEVIPYLEEHYRCRSERIIAGHSHGGVFAVNTLIHQPALFDKYIGTDPAFQIINANLPDSLATDAFAGKSLYINSSDGLYGFGADISTDMFTNNVIFQNFRMQNEDAGLRFFAEHIEDDHGNSFMTGFHRGLRWIQEWPISKATVRKDE